ncbi:MAG: carotenoid biosynthesis protein, partial [Bacteroidota bacterium]
PLTLIFTTYLIFLFHQFSFKVKELVFFSFVYLFTFFIEVAGVQTGSVFGNYYYGIGLGPKLFDTPLMIGINWLFLSYITASISNRLINSNRLLKIAFASFLMLFYDVVVELVADFLGMWYWHNSIIPIQNYVVWFFVSFFIQSVYYVAKIRFNNPLSFLIYFSQMLFLLIVFIVKNFIYD